jgi:hypothetical protein
MDISPQIILDATEAEVVPGKTARYPFTVRTGGRYPPAADFDVVPDNPRFDPEWIRIVRATDELQVTRYELEVTPDEVQRDQYGRHPLRIYWPSAGNYWQRGSGPGSASARCVLVIKPGVRLTAKPVLTTWRAGKLTLSIENFSKSDVDVEISVEHHGSDWTRGWEFELETGAGPVKFSEEFELPEDGRRGKFTLNVSAAGIPLISAELSGRTLVIPRKATVTAAVLAAGAALGTGLALAGPGSETPATTTAQSTPTASAPPSGASASSPAGNGGSGTGLSGTGPASGAGASPGAGVSPSAGASGDTSGTPSSGPGGGSSSASGSATQQSQAITFTSAVPAGAAPEDTYVVTATGGASGEPVTFAIDASAQSVCSISGNTVTFSQAGNCLVDANQGGNGQFLAAPQAQQSIPVAKLPQPISFIAPVRGASTVIDQGVDLIATGGGSGNPVTFAIDSLSTASCKVQTVGQRNQVVGLKPGTCVIDASQDGNDRYAAGRQLRAIAITVPPPSASPILS